jgi:hypothetical protein
MDKDVYSFALKHTLDEVQKVCPDIKSVFVLDENSELIAKDENTGEKTVSQAVDLFKEIIEKAETVGGVEDITVQGINGRVNISHMEEIYLFTVTSDKADLNYVRTVTHVLVPTVLKVLQKITPAPLTRSPPKIEKETENSTAENAEEPEMEKHVESVQPEERSESILPEAPVTQFIVEDMKGLLTPSDSVRIDSSIMEQWNELYEGRNMEEADVETFGGKSIRCKVKPIKDLRLEGQGKIQIPGKLQDILEIRKGELVRVKPVVE